MAFRSYRRIAKAARRKSRKRPLWPLGDADALARAMLGALSANHDREALKAADFAPEVIGSISAAALSAGG